MGLHTQPWLVLGAVLCLGSAHAAGPDDPTDRVGRAKPAAPAAAEAEPGSQHPKTAVECVVPLVAIAEAIVDTANNRAGKTHVDYFDPAVYGPQLTALGYTNARLLGRGAHGAVFEVEKDGRLLAVKIPYTMAFSLFLPIEEAYIADVQKYVATQKLKGAIPRDAPNYFPGNPTVVTAPAAGLRPETQVLQMDRVAVSAKDATSASSLFKQLLPTGVDTETGNALKYHLPRALEQLHGAGIVHRDLKPANVLMGDDHLPVIVDFGIAARRGRSADQVGGKNTTSGTLAYMGPEQHTESEATPKMDVFAAKKILLEALVGNDPWHRWTDPLQVNSDPTKQEKTDWAKRWLRAPEEKIGRLAIVLTMNVVRDGKELREMVDMAEDPKVSDAEFLTAMGKLLKREKPEVIVNELLCSLTLIKNFPNGLGFDADLAKAVTAAYPTVMREHERRRIELLRMGNLPSTAMDGNLSGYRHQLGDRISALQGGAN